MMRLLILWLGIFALFISGCAKEQKDAVVQAASVPTEETLAHAPGKLADFLIYNGPGVDPTDSESLAKIIESHGLTQRTITEKELNAMSAETFAKYGTFVWPGGDNDEMSPAITNNARLQLRKAVLSLGLNYLGICAGAFIAVGPKTSPEELPAEGLAIVEGEYLSRYVPKNQESISMVKTKFADGTQRDLILWYGPFFRAESGVIARYADDNTPAMIQTRVNNSFVVLSGPHPEAPADWQTFGNLSDPDGLDLDIAWKLLEAAHKQKPLPTF